MQQDRKAKTARPGGAERAVQQIGSAGCGSLVAVVGTGLLLTVVVVVVVPLVLGIAHDSATDRSEGTTDGGPFQTTAALMADNAAEGRPTETADHRARLSVGTGSTGNGGDDQREREEFCEFGFHKLVFGMGDGDRHFVWTAAPLKYSGLSRILGPRLLFHTPHRGTDDGFHKGKILPPENLECGGFGWTRNGS